MEQNKIQNDIDVEILKNVYSENEISKSIFEILKEYQGKSNVTVINGLPEKLNIPRQKVVAFFKQLEEANCGHFMPGRWEHPSRFEWDVDFTRVEQIASGKAIEVNKSEEEEIKRKKDGKLNTNILTHTFFLRSDFTLELKLPTDLSATEASRLADFIKTLPFN